MGLYPHKGAAAVIPVMDDGRLLMVRQYRNALDRFTLELPAGGLDQADEPGRDCSARELEEETGYRSDDLEWLITLRTTVALCNEKIEVYVARNLIRTHQHLDENEFVNDIYQGVSVREIIDNSYNTAYYSVGDYYRNASSDKLRMN